jgi:Pentapeptide repeats (8 copies)
MEGKMSWWIAAGVIAIVALATALWWWLPKWEVNRLRLTIRDAKARADIEDNLRKTINQLIGGAAVLIGAAFAYYQSQLTSQATHDQLISQQVSKGFDLLGQAGNDKVTVRVGGAYALEGVMNTSEQYHQPVLETLCTFVRDGTKDYKGDGPPATDIQAALTVIGRRAAGPGVVDLRGANVPKAHLSGARANLTGALLIEANLTGADLSSAKLSGADELRQPERRSPRGRQPERCQPERRQAELRRPEPRRPEPRQPEQSRTK